jgi:hypothetical protein
MVEYESEILIAEIKEATKVEIEDKEWEKVRNLLVNINEIFKNRLLKDREKIIDRKIDRKIKEEEWEIIKK